MKDCLENEIKVGDQIVYPNRHGGNMWLCSGTVKEIGTNRIKVTKTNGRVVTVSALKRVAVVKPVAEIHVVEATIEKYPLSALGVPIKPGDRGVIMKWDEEVDGLASWSFIMPNCNKTVTVDIKPGLMKDTLYITVRGDEEGFVYPACQFVHIGTKFDGNLTKLTRHNKLAWITALRSGEFSQTSGGLCVAGKYCCLGVACELAGLEKAPYDGGGGVKVKMPSGTWRHSLLDSGLFGLTSDNGLLAGIEGRDGHQSLATLNDSGLTFNQIADIIEYFL